MSELEYWQLERIVNAHELLQRFDMTEALARQKLEEYRTIERWLGAERLWKQNVKVWLKAETLHALKLERLDGECYAAACRGWTLMKQYVPSLDGVPTFDALPDSLQFRYASFAAGVLGKLPPPEVKSAKQQVREASYA